MNRKVLILSMGTGRKSEGAYPYQTINYCFGNEGDTIESPFVAEALIEKIQPDLIIMVGTVKSAWDAFYHKYHKEMDDFQKTWKEIEDRSAKLNKDSAESDVMEYQAMLNQRYAEDLEIKGNPKIEVCLIPYGLAEDELKTSYRKISGCLRDSLKGFSEEDSIEISFDITHSFRSIPIYNLVVIDYCRLLMPQNIHISHVFYGNLDVARENDNVAQIVDLKDIVNILETTRGISEFYNTGNATTFLRWCSSNQQEEDEFIRSLSRFHGAMHMNNRGELQKALEQMLCMELQGDRNSLLDAKTTIREKLQNEIPYVVNDGESNVEKQINKAEFQIHLATWCLKHGQVGLASAIAKEGFRSFLVAIYEKDTSKYEEENARRRAEQKFANLIEKSAGNVIFKTYDEIENKARSIRNIYAHNLESLENEPLNYLDAKQTIQAYVNAITTIMMLEREEFETKKEVSVISEKKKKVSIWVSNKEFSPEDMQKLSAREVEIYQLMGDYSIKEKSGKEQLKRLSRIIAWTLEDLLIMYIDDVDVSIMWGEDIEPALYQNASSLIKSYMPERKIHIMKWEKNKQMPLKLDSIWKIDLENECNKSQKDTEQKRYEWKKLI